MNSTLVLNEPSLHINQQMFNANNSVQGAPDNNFIQGAPFNSNTQGAQINNGKCHNNFSQIKPSLNQCQVIVDDYICHNLIM